MGNGEYIEIWQPHRNDMLKGKAYYIFNKDTVSTENMNLLKLEEHMVYIPILKAQHPIFFTLTSSTDSLWVFENKEHDFPQVISYFRDSSTKLAISINGLKNGNLEQQNFFWSGLTNVILALLLINISKIGVVT